METVRPKILVVDDQDQTRAVHRRILSALDADVIEAATGYEAMEAVRQHDFAVALLDVRMPEMDGLELASLMRRSRRATDTPIIFITAAAREPEEAKLAYRLGAVDYLTSGPEGPVDVEVLRHKAQLFVDIFRTRTDLHRRLADSEARHREAADKAEQYRQQVEEVRQQGMHDQLSGLPNRMLFEDRLEGALRRAQRSRQLVALAFVDLDKFKPVNDEYGHSAGDELLVTIARRLKEAVRGSDTVARLGGDEFAVICEGLESEAGAGYIADKLVRAATKPVTLTSTLHGTSAEVALGVSIGIALFPAHAKSRDELLMRSDHAMYAVKRDGGGVRLYQPSDSPEKPVEDAGEPLRAQVVDLKPK